MLNRNRQINALTSIRMKEVSHCEVIKYLSYLVCALNEVKGMMEFMIEYSYRDIKKIMEVGIIFSDGYELFFEECKNEWAVKNLINKEQSCCVAERNCLTKPPFFLFYTKEKVKIIFDKKGILSKMQNQNDFHKLQITLRTER